MSEIIETSTIPHRKFTIPIPWNKKCGKSVTYYIAGIPCDGIRGFSEFQIHECIEGDGEGYGGSFLNFLMEDGTTERVKGPFFKHKESNARILYEILIAKDSK